MFFINFLYNFLGFLFNYFLFYFIFDLMIWRSVVNFLVSLSRRSSLKASTSFYRRRSCINVIRFSHELEWKSCCCLLFLFFETCSKMINLLLFRFFWGFDCFFFKNNFPSIFFLFILSLLSVFLYLLFSFFFHCFL